MRSTGLALLSMFALAACTNGDNTKAPPFAPTASFSREGNGGGDDDDAPRGMVYTLTNAPAGNAVRTYARASNGSLAFVEDVQTGGTGTGGGLGNQGALAFADDEKFLLAVSAGSNQLSALRMRHSGLELRSVVNSGGTTPVSVTSHEGLVYVLNAGGTGNISGFRISSSGALAPVAGSMRALSNAAAGAAQVAFSPNGNWLVVTEKATNKILTFPVKSDGTTGAVVTTASAGQTPFGFEFTDRGLLVVSEAFGGAAGKSAASSYRLGGGGSLAVQSASVPTTQSAACWVAITPNNRFAYVTNTASATVTGYRIGSDGTLTRLDAGVTGMTQGGPIDAAFTDGGRFLYTLNAGAHSISTFEVNSDGSLAGLGAVAGVPAGSTGLVAR